MKYFLVIFSSLFIFSAFSQTLKGFITDVYDIPIPYASIYVKETKQGIVANFDGEFQIKFLPGIYHLEIRCMGYENNNQAVTIVHDDVELTVKMQLKDIQLQEVEIRVGDDRAYAIMRHTIKMAPYYQSIIKESTYNAYSKGAGKIVSITGLLNSMSKGELEKFENKLFLQESFSEIKFMAPDKYEQKVIAFSNTFPNMDDPQYAIMMGQASLYNPKYGDAVSPLHPKAFDYYRFRYEGYEEENGQIINKIRIIPKLKDPQLMEGVIYIADDEWNIRHAEITLFPVGSTQNIKLDYYPVIDNIYLVTSYNTHLDVNLLGMKLEADFLSSIQYSDIQLNDSLIIAHQKKEKSLKKKEKKNLEIQDDDHIKRIIDTLALQRDSMYWSKIRTVVLNEEESKSYIRKDTIQALIDSIDEAERNPKFKPGDLLLGGKLGSDSSFLYFTYSGLLNAIPEYNFVDGFWIGQSFNFNFKKKKNSGIIINPFFYWTSARKKWIGNMDFLFDYAPKRLGNFNLSLGKASEDFSGKNGMERLLNMAYSLITGKNYAKFYDNSYLKIFNQIDIINGLQLGAGFETARRHLIDNHIAWNLSGKEDKVTPNIPSYNYSLQLNYEHSAKYTIHLKYTPEYYYRIKNGKKQYLHSRFPTFELNYQQGLDCGGNEFYSRFSRIELSMKQKIKFGIFNRLTYQFIAGKFFNTNLFNYIDYKHFNTSGNAWSTFKTDNNSYALLPFYTYSTNQTWIQTFVNYNTDYLVLKRLPFLQGKLFTETLQAKFLHTPDKKYYSEWGYSVNLPANLLCISMFLAFDSFRYSQMGLQLSAPFLSTAKK
jgi:hypothetical protein